MWRIGGDIGPNWDSVLRLIDSDTAHASAAGPGAWNDADMLEVSLATSSSMIYVLDALTPHLTRHCVWNDAAGWEWHERGSGPSTLHHVVAACTSLMFWKRSHCPRSLCPDRTHHFWQHRCMLASPLVAGNDVRTMSETTRRILTNKWAIEVNLART